MMDDLPYAEDINYWKTSKSSPDTWMERAVKLINAFGGKVVAYAFGTDHSINRQAYMISFDINSDSFKIIWPVLPTYSGEDELAAKRQAATLLHHDIKAKLLSATVLGHRMAFFNYLLLPNGRTTSQIALKDYIKGIPLFEQINQAKIEYQE